ncbi:auxin efflux carrier component 6-like [Vicia villosa]|uniref:auxin efflux carrier component 6-like n=1 Tax=Vicia villosa TaxID=3911 RepID=UPI00273A8CA3|nr:auxin efflux carrier component 6-like [Vicia villosa]
MVTGEDLYNVMCAMVPLYFAMLVSYGSVKCCKMFTPEQCSGINRFVAVFAVPVLSFHFISLNNPYQMDTKFILADTVSKVLVLFFLSVWAICFVNGSLDWVITLFSVATLPNTLVMGIPLLQAMYGDFTESLMVQLVVLQCIIWYTVLLFLLEYRAAKLLIKTEFPGNKATSITKFELDGDVISLYGQDAPLQTLSETDENGRIKVRIRRSTSSAPAESTSSITTGITPTRLSNLSNADIFSINTPLNFLDNPSASPRFSGYASTDAYSLQPTPRASNVNEAEICGTPGVGRSPVGGGRGLRGNSPEKWQGGERQGCKDFTMSDKEISFRDSLKVPMAGEAVDPKDQISSNQKMPYAFVMLRLILIVVGRKLSRNPNTYSSLLGLLWSLISFKWNVEIPSLIKSSIKIISDASLGMAMFSLGLFMALQPRIIACGTKKAAMGMAIRFLFGPLVMSLSSIAIGLRGKKLHTAIVQAALPQGIVPFVFAREYGLHPDILSTGVIFGMLISLPITLIYYIFLGL